MLHRCKPERDILAVRVRLNESIVREYRGIGSPPVKSLKSVLAMCYRYFQDLIEDTEVDGSGGPSERQESQNKATSLSSTPSPTHQDASKNPIAILSHALIPATAFDGMKTRKSNVLDAMTLNVMPISIPQLPADPRDIRAEKERKERTADLDGNPKETLQEGHNWARGRPRADKQKLDICPVVAMENDLAYTTARRDASEGAKGSKSAGGGRGTRSSSNRSLTDSVYVPDGGSNLPSQLSLIPLSNVTKRAIASDGSLSNALPLPGMNSRQAEKKVKTAASVFGDYFGLYWIRNSSLPCVYYELEREEVREDQFHVQPICCNLYHYYVQV
jgi:hypothetical protein